MGPCHVMRTARPIGVLQGGSGRARASAAQPPLLAALLRPLPRAPTRVGGSESDARER